MSRGLLALLMIASGGLACPRSRPSVAPTSEGAPDSAASGSAATPAPDLSALRPWMHALFEPGLRRTYAWTYAVDTHDEDGSIAKADGTLRCRSDVPTRHALDDGEVAWVSCQACEVEAGRNDIELAFDDCYLATAAGLWVMDGSPADEAEVRHVIAEPPYLPASPEPRNDEAPGGERYIESMTWTRVEKRTLQVLGRTVTAWCRNDGNSQAYGENLTRCFVPGLGLVSLEWDGRSGPSEERYFLVELPGSEAPPPSSPAPLDPALAELPRWLRALFDPAPRRIYEDTDYGFFEQCPDCGEEVLRLHCRSDGPTRLELGEGRIAFISCQTCDSLPDRHHDAECFIGTTEGLWIAPEGLGAADTRLLVVSTPPYLPAVLRPHAESRTREPRGRDAMIDSVEVGERSLTVIGQHVDAWCRTDTSKAVRFVEGTTRCFTPELGLVTFDRRSSFGPLLKTRRLIEIDPLPRR